MEGVSPEHWEVVRRPDGHFTLLAKNAAGEYRFDNEASLIKAAQALDPVVINNMLFKSNKCTCPMGLGRCQYKFSFIDACRLRGEVLTSKNPVADIVHQLQSHESNRDTAHVKYYLKGIPVCRGFFGHCLGISERTVDDIANRVRGRTKLPPAHFRIPAQHSQYDACVAFWQSFFSKHAQTSDGHRCVPINLSNHYIYINMFWPWWKDLQGDWPPFADAPIRFVTEADYCKDEESVEDENEVEAKLSVSENSQENIPGKVSDQMQAEDHPALQDIMEDQAKSLTASQREAGLPSYPTFMRARHDKQLEDVKRARKESSSG